ncbi:MAG: serine-type D-Ala-D-Ala carboxypeptidase, partial [Pseudomonadales bacterium]
QAAMDLGTVIKAPLSVGQELGRLSVVIEGDTIADVPLSSDAAVEQAGFFKRLWDAIALFFVGLFGGDTLSL